MKELPVGLGPGGPPEAVVKGSDLVGPCGTSVEAVVVLSQFVVTGGSRMMPLLVEEETGAEVVEGLDDDVVSELPLPDKTEN